MNNPMKERTLILAKPDALQRGLVGLVIQRFEQRGSKLVGIKMTKPPKDLIRKHYMPTKEQLEGMGKKTLEHLQMTKRDPIQEMGTDDPMHIGSMINEWNVDFMGNNPIVAMVFEGLHAVEIGRKIVGHTLPSKADLGTIRGDFSSDSPTLANAKKRGIRNLVHASGSVDEAKREISLWFEKKELFDYQRFEHEAMY